MNPGLGINAWAGWGVESTWGTKVAATAFLEIPPGESLNNGLTYFQSKALNGAAVKKLYPGTSKAAGDLPCEFQFEGLELLLKHLMGSASSAVSGTGYKHTFTPTDDLMAGKGLTVEIFRDAPTAKSFHHVGCKIPKGVFAINRDAVLMFTPTFLGKSVEIDTKSASPTPPTAPSALQTQLAVSVGTFTGTVDVFSGTIEIANPLGEDRFNLAAGALLKEPVRSAKRTVLINFEAEFGEEVQQTEWTDGTEGQLIWTWTGPEYAVGEDYELVITANGQFTARQPNVADEGPVKMPTTFQCFENGSTPDIKIELTNEVVSIP